MRIPQKIRRRVFDLSEYCDRVNPNFMTNGEMHGFIEIIKKQIERLSAEVREYEDAHD